MIEYNMIVLGSGFRNLFFYFLGVAAICFMQGEALAQTCTPLVYDLVQASGTQAVMYTCGGSEFFKPASTRWNLSTPYFLNYKDFVFGENFKLTVRPAFEVQYLDPSSDGSMQTTQWAPILNTNNTFKISESLWSSYTLEFRYSDSQTSTAASDRNFRAMIQATQTYLFNKWTKEALTLNTAYSTNSADEHNVDGFYHRYEAGLTYVYPLPKELSLNFGANGFLSNFEKHNPQRVDHQYVLSTGVTKLIKKWAKWMVTASYSDQRSTDLTQKYKQYTILTSALFDYMP